MNTEKCTSWVERDKKVMAPTQHLSYFPLVVESGKGSIIRDLDGNEYIDFLSSASSLNLGTCNDHVKAAVEEQLKKYSQYTIAYTYNLPEHLPDAPKSSHSSTVIMAILTVLLP